MVNMAAPVAEVIREEKRSLSLFLWSEGVKTSGSVWRRADQRCYNRELQTVYEWAECTLRQWPNTDVACYGWPWTLKVPIHVRVWLASPARLGSGSNELDSSVCRAPRAGLARAFCGARLAIGSYVCGWSRASLAYPHAKTVWVLLLKGVPCRLPCLKHSWALIFDSF
jgi:hypothetical protein